MISVDFCHILASIALGAMEDVSGETEDDPIRGFQVLLMTGEAWHSLASRVNSRSTSRCTGGNLVVALGPYRQVLVKIWG